MWWIKRSQLYCRYSQSHLIRSKNKRRFFFELGGIWIWFSVCLCLCQKVNSGNHTKLQNWDQALAIRVDSEDPLCTSDIKRRLWCIHLGFKTHGQSQLKSETESTSGYTKLWHCPRKNKKQNTAKLRIKGPTVLHKVHLWHLAMGWGRGQKKITKRYPSSKYDKFPSGKVLLK